MDKTKTSDDLIKNSSIIIVATTIANISNYGFHIFMSRKLGPADYGILNSLLALFLIFGLPMLAIQTVITKYISTFQSLNQERNISAFLIFAVKLVLKCCIVCIIIFTLLSGKISSFLNIESRIPVLILGFALVLNMILPIGFGFLQGLQKFIYLGFGIVMSTLGRLIFGILLVIIGFGVNGAIGASVLAIMIAIVIIMFPLRNYIKSKSSNSQRIGVERKNIIGYAGPVLLALLAFSMLTNIDIIFVKHFFTSEDAGFYSAASIIGKAFLYLPMSIVLVMFPKVSESHAKFNDSQPLLIKSLLLAGCLLVVGIIICIAFPGIIIAILFGDEYSSIGNIIILFSLAMTPLSLTNIIINYNLARERRKFIINLFVALLLYIGFLLVFHDSLVQILIVMGSVGLIIFLYNLYLVIVRK